MYACDRSYSRASCCLLRTEIMTRGVVIAENAIGDFLNGNFASQLSADKAWR